MSRSYSYAFNVLVWVRERPMLIPEEQVRVQVRADVWTDGVQASSFAQAAANVLQDYRFTAAAEVGVWLADCRWGSQVHFEGCRLVDGRFYAKVVRDGRVPISTREVRS